MTKPNVDGGEGREIGSWVYRPRKKKKRLPEISYFDRQWKQRMETAIKKALGF